MGSGQDKVVFVAVTGAQGVGKSTFCREIAAVLRKDQSIDTSLLCGLGDTIRAKGVPLGAASNSDTIFAIFHEHLRREREAAADVVLLDRCIVDALAYTRVLGLTSVCENLLLEEIAQLAAKRLTLVIELQLSHAFAVTAATHENPAMRNAVSTTIPSIISELGVPSISLDASKQDALKNAVNEIRQILP